MTGRPFKQVDHGLRVFVRLTPNAKKDGVQGVMDGGAGQMMLKASVTAIPEKGKANAALVKMLSKAWGIAKSDIEISAGETDRRKTLLLKGDPLGLEQQLSEWMEQNDG